MTRRRVLFVTPCTFSSGETITASHIAAELAFRDIDCWFAASAQAGRILGSTHGGRVVALGDSLADNQATWREAMTTLRPDAIVFADYPLLFFSSGAVPLADAEWVADLGRFPGVLFTLDHLGYAQRRQIVYFGPPHLTFGAEVTADLPERMEILLPCPTHEPGAVPNRNGLPTRYWAAAEGHAEGEARKVRRRHLNGDDGILVFHSTPSWASRLAAQLRLPHYRFLPSILQHCLSDLGYRVTIVSVNDGAMLAPSGTRDVRFVMLTPLDPAEYEALLSAADLMLTDNAVSASLGKAVCSLTPCALLRNTFELTQLPGAVGDTVTALAIAMENERPGAIFPFDVFPVWDESALERLGFNYASSYGQTFARLELFGGETTRTAIAALLFDTATRSTLRNSQRRYVSALTALPSAADAIALRIDGG